MYSFQITDLQTSFAHETERVNAMISILQSDNEQMKSKITTLETIIESMDNNNITEPGEEPCGYPCAEHISDIDARVSLILDIKSLHITFIA